MGTKKKGDAVNVIMNNIEKDEEKKEVRTRILLHDSTGNPMSAGTIFTLTSSFGKPRKR